MKKLPEGKTQVCTYCNLSFTKFPLAFPTSVEVEAHIESCRQNDMPKMREEEKIIRAYFGLC
ncbi:hypothetical protein ACH0B6_20490 [Solibacillus silvestris]